MITLLLSFLFTVIFIFFFGYVVHWSLHQSWMGTFNNSHMTHHLKLYPPEDYSSDSYRWAGKDSTVWIFAVASIPVLAVPVILFFAGVLSLFTTIAVLATMLGQGFLHNYIHDAFHVKNHWMNRVPVLKDIFHRWNHLHYLHHVDMSKNYGIFAFFFDRLFGTYWDIK